MLDVFAVQRGVQRVLVLLDSIIVAAPGEAFAVSPRCLSDCDGLTTMPYHVGQRREAGFAFGQRAYVSPLMYLR